MSVLRAVWGDAPAAVPLYGRDRDLALLDEAVASGARVLAVTGPGGLGKSTLARVWAERRGRAFDTAFWIGFKDRADLTESFQQLRQFLTPETVVPSLPLPQQVEEVVELLRSRRLLLVLDNLETVMDTVVVGSFLGDHAALETLTNRVVEADGLGTLVLTAREVPTVVSTLARQASRLVHRPLEGLVDPGDRRALVVALGFPDADDRDVAAFAAHHDGNPYAMALAADLIASEYPTGGLHDYVAAGCPLPGGTTALLAEQFDRLSSLERTLLAHMAVSRTPVHADELVRALAFRHTPAEVTAAFAALDRRSLLEPPTDEGRSLQNLLLEFMTERVVADLAEALHGLHDGGEVDEVVSAVPIAVPAAPRQVRAAQARTVAEPVLDRLALRWGGRHAVQERLATILDRFDRTSWRELGYAPGTAVNLLVQLGAPLPGSLHNLPLWNCDLSNVELHHVDMTGCDLRGSTVRSVLAAVSSVCFDDEGARLYAGTTNGMLHVWDGQTWERRSVLAHEGFVRDLAFDAGSRRVLTVGDDRRVRCWSSESLQDLGEIDLADVRLRCVAVDAATGAVAFGGEGGLLRVYQDGDVTPVAGHVDAVRGLLFRDGALISVCEGGRVVETPIGDPDGSARTLALGQPLWCVAEVDTDRVVAAGRRGEPIVIDADELVPVDEGLPGIGTPIWRLAMVDGALAASTSDGSVVFFDVAGRAVEQTLPLHGNWVRALAVSEARGVLATGGEDHAIHVLRSSDRSTRRSIEGAAQSMWAARSLGDGRLVAAGSDGVLHVWDGEERRVVALGRSRRWIRAVAVSPDGGTVVAGCDDGDVYLWDVATDAVRPIGRHPGGEVWSIDFHPTRPLVATAGEDGTVRLWSLERDEASETVVHEHGSWAVSVRFDPEGALVASGSDEGLVLVSGLDGSGLTELEDEASRQPWALGWSGGSVIAGGRDGCVRRWALDRPASPVAVHDWQAPVWALIVDGDEVVVCGDGGRVSVLAASDLTERSARSTGTARNHDVALVPDAGLLVLAGEDGVVYEMPRRRRAVAALRHGGVRVRVPMRQYEGLRVSIDAGMSADDMASLELLGARADDVPVGPEGPDRPGGAGSLDPPDPGPGFDDGATPDSESPPGGADPRGLVLLVVLAIFAVLAAFFFFVVFGT